MIGGTSGTTLLQREALDEGSFSYWHTYYSTAESGQRTAAAAYLVTQTNPDSITLTDSTTMGTGLVYGALKLAPGIVSGERNERAVAEPALPDKN